MHQSYKSQGLNYSTAILYNYAPALGLRQCQHQGQCQRTVAELAVIYSRSTSNRKLDEANKLFQRVLEPNNKSHKVYGLAAYAYAQFIDAHPEIAVNQDSSKYLNIAQKKGVLNDYGKLGNYYYNMLDYSNAKLYYEKALKGNQGDKANGLFGLGMLYFEGKGVKQDYSQALSYYEQAKSLNHAAAAVRLGQMYAQGL